MEADAPRPRLLMSAGAAVVRRRRGCSRSRIPRGLLRRRLLEGIAAAAVAPVLRAILAAVRQNRLALRVGVTSFFELTLLAGLAMGRHRRSGTVLMTLVALAFLVRLPNATERVT